MAELNPYLKTVIDRPNARERIEELLKSGKAARSVADSQCKLACLYAHGSQWGIIGYDGEDKRLTLDRVSRQPVGRSGKRQRVTCNVILPDIRTQRSQFVMPDPLPYQVVPASGSAMDYNASQVGQRLLQPLIRMGRVARRYKDASDARFMLGSCYLHLVRRVLDEGQPVPDPERPGEYLADDNGRTVYVPASIIEPAVIWPYQIIVDPANRSRDIPDHEVYVIQSVMTLGEIYAYYGVDLRNSKEIRSIGNYREMTTANEYMALATETTILPHASDSNIPAVPVFVAYWRDRTNPDIWPTMSVYSPDVSRDNGMIYHGRNPLLMRTLYRFDYEPVPGQFHSKGIPHLMAPFQDFINVAMTGVINTMANVGTKWFYESGTLDPRARDALLSNIAITPIPVNRHTNPNAMFPQLAPTPQIPNAFQQVLDAGLGLAHQASATSDVMRGQIQTHQPAEALQVQGRRSDSVLDERLGEDARELSDMLMAMLTGFGSVAPMYQLTELGGGELPEQQIRDFQSACRAGRRLDIGIEKNDLVPLNARQRQDFLMALQQSGQLQPGAPILRYLRTYAGIHLDDTERRAESRAIDENRRIRLGREVEEPQVFELHEIHLEHHLREYNDPNIDSESRGRLHEHIAETYAMIGRHQALVATRQQMGINELSGRPLNEGIGGPTEDQAQLGAGALPEDLAGAEESPEPPSGPGGELAEIPAM